MDTFKPSILLALALTAPVMAQPSALEEIIVTAEFRDTALLEQPTSTTVLTSQTIRARAAQHLEEVLGAAPNVNFASGTSRARFFQVRGIGQRSQFQDPLNPSIGLVIDGIDFSGLGTAGTLNDVAQVEVLRGPQGTLHGANALGGLINIRTGEPQAEPGLQLSATAADYDTWSTAAVGTGPLVRDQLLYRLSVSTYRSDGFIENDYLRRDDTNDRDETGVRGKLRWLAGERNTLDLVALYTDIDNGYDAFSLDNTRHTLSDEPGWDRLESSALGLRWHLQLDGLAVESSISGALTETDYGFDEDWAYVGIAPDNGEYSSSDRYQRERDSYSAQLRLLSDRDSPVFGTTGDWVAGIYYLGDTEDLLRRYTYLSGDFRSRYATDSAALFGQLSTELGSALRLTSGLRAERRTTRYTDSNAVDSDPAETLWGGRLVLEYQAHAQQMLYAGISRGYSANGVNPTVTSSIDTTADPSVIAQLQRVQTFDAEYLVNYEAGFKGRFWNGAMRTRLALFYMDRSDQQVKGSLVIERNDGSTYFIDYTNNAAAGSNYGLELELDWLASDTLMLYANLGLLRTEFEDYVNADGVDLSGREQAQAPAYQYAAGGRYDFGHGLYLRLDVEGKDNFYFSDRHDVQAPASNLLHLRLGYDGDAWSLALWGRNLTDENYYVRGFGSFGNDPRKGYVVEPYYQFGEPRMLGISLDFNFGAMRKSL